MSRRKTEPGQYEIGYGRPPVHTRFRKGQSGNPKGRPRGRRSIGAELDRILCQQIAVREGGAAASVTKRQALLMSLLTSAIKGNTRSATLVLRLVEMRDQERDRDQPDRAVGSSGHIPVHKSVEDLTEGELEWLLAFLNHVVQPAGEP